MFHICALLESICMLLSIDKRYFLFLVSVSLNSVIAVLDADFHSLPSVQHRQQYGPVCYCLTITISASCHWLSQFILILLTVMRLLCFFILTVGGMFHGYYITWNFAPKGKYLLVTSSYSCHNLCLHHQAQPVYDYMYRWFSLNDLWMIKSLIWCLTV